VDELAVEGAGVEQRGQVERGLGDERHQWNCTTVTPIAPAPGLSECK
jgi:hypothetical protein